MRGTGGSPEDKEHGHRNAANGEHDHDQMAQIRIDVFRGNNDREDRPDSEDQ